ncbi:hypothetical protein BFP97_14850 [Roseivirga sp. 4D4]|uniref:BglII/BstYI family type II restriction endonuclease n=1 Tax=Roseivirga sp. 4D4 TaxID=1889784 RepID=UPI0008538280|nr:BglII/BstYI family type II restriction endonuclease [Roseivirga sp. 4D4]OEK03881.1 hypothetical protein BFP97_14850 [Roseivirga sp. 4D4]
MSNYYKNPEVLTVFGYEVYFTRFADSIIKDHFQDALSDLEKVLEEFQITEAQLISAGGGLSSITQNLRDKLYEHNWEKINIESEHKVREKVLTSESHEIDHYKEFGKGNIGLEIEWNNKDPFFDRDLENFRKLHQLGELTLGIIITRGESLQQELIEVYKRFLNDIYPYSIEQLSEKLSLSQKASARISNMVSFDREESVAAIARLLCSSKYGTSTTHMQKLTTRMDRGVGDPCPCVLIGIGKERISA